jgi:hypothetical protein
MDTPPFKGVAGLLSAPRENIPIDKNRETQVKVIIRKITQ